MLISYLVFVFSHSLSLSLTHTEYSLRYSPFVLTFSIWAVSLSSLSLLYYTTLFVYTLPASVLSIFSLFNLLYIFFLPNYLSLSIHPSIYLYLTRLPFFRWSYSPSLSLSYSLSLCPMRYSFSMCE